MTQTISMREVSIGLIHTCGSYTTQNLLDIVLISGGFSLSFYSDSPQKPPTSNTNPIDLAVLATHTLYLTNNMQELLISIYEVNDLLKVISGTIS